MIVPKLKSKCRLSAEAHNNLKEIFGSRVFTLIDWKIVEGHLNAVVKTNSGTINSFPVEYLDII